MIFILHGRRQEKLEERAKDLERTHNTSAQIIIAELSQADGMKKIEEHIRNLDRLNMLAGVLPRPVYYRLMQVIGEKMKKRWDEIEKTSKARYN